MPHVTTELIMEFLESQQWVIGAEIDQTWGLQIAEQVVNAFSYDDPDEVRMVLHLLNTYRMVKEKPETQEATRAYLLYDLLTNGRYGLGIASTIADAHDDAFPLVGGGCPLTEDVLSAYVDVTTFMAAEIGLSTDPPFVDDLTSYLIEELQGDAESVEAATYSLILRATMVEPWQSFSEDERQEHRAPWTRRLAEIMVNPDRGPSSHGRTRSPEEKLRENSVESMLRAIVAGPISRQQEREVVSDAGTKVDTVFEAPKGNAETCEIVFVSTTVPIPGPYMTFYANWVSFQAETSGGTPTRVIVPAGESDEWAQKEFHAHRIDETPKRKKMVAEVIRKLEAQGWKAYGIGEMWFSHRFYRPR